MVPDFENPFASSGKIVSGPGFIGREYDLQTIARRVTRPSEPGSIAIIGVPRIGKSSLVYQAVMKQKEELIDKKILPIWLNLALYKEPDLFFRSLVTYCSDELEDLGWSTDTIRLAVKCATQGEFVWETTYHDIQHFFMKVSEEKISIIFVLDEFDHACELFKENSTRFQGLRELAYHNWGVRWIFISRRTIRDIEQRSRAISNLGNIVLEHPLKMFTDRDLQLYFQQLEEIGISVTPIMRQKINFYCGQHPYLLGTVGYHLVELHRQSQVEELEIAINIMKKSLDDYLERIIDVLKKLGEGDSLNKLLQILYGPVLDVNQTNLNLLLSYGLIKPNPERLTELSGATAAYVAFSGYFQSYLSFKVQEMDVWDILGETERTLRDLIAEKFRIKYSEEHWLDIIETKCKVMFDVWKKNKQSAERNWKSKAPQNILSYAYPKELFQVMFTDWKEFYPIFGNDKNYWDKRAQHLSKVRTPLSHNYAEVMSEEDRLLAQGYCEEILELVRKEPQILEQNTSLPLAAQGSNVLPQVGAIISGQYEIVRIVKKTRHSYIVKARDSKLERDVAIKFLLNVDSSLDSLATRRANLEREGKLLAQLNHPNVGTVYTTTTDPLGVVLAWIEGGPLSLTEYAYDDLQDMPLPMIVQIASQLCNALDYIHDKQIIHRDIKPNNIILNEQNTPILIDFDIARSSQHETVSQDKKGVYHYVGNELYSAPEQFTMPGSVTSAADIFSLGAVLYQLLTHHQPFANYNNPYNYKDELLPPLEQEDIPEPLFEILCEMLSQQPEQRPKAHDLHARFTQYKTTLS